MHYPARRALSAAVLAAAIASLSPRADAQPQQPTFRGGVSLATLDVIPRSSNGQFVGDLTKEDFEVLEDGAPQQIASVVRVVGGRVFNLLAPPPEDTGAPEGIILPATRTPDVTAGRVFVVIVDDLHFTAIDTPVVRKLLKKVAAQLIHPGDMFAMFSTGPSSVEVPMTYDHNMLTEAISKVAGHGMSYRDIMDAHDGSQGPQGLRQNAHVAFSTVYELLSGLERVRDRRKAVVLVSNGYDFDPFPQGRQGTDQVFGGRYGTPWVDPERGDKFLSLEQQNNHFADSDLSSELAALAGAANRVNATIYALDPRGLVTTVDVADQIDITDMRTHISKTQSSLKLLSESTGGIAVVNDNTYDDALKRIEAETGDYYMLGYYAPGAEGARQTRQIEVRIKRPGVTAQSRAWYRTKGKSRPATAPKP